MGQYPVMSRGPTPPLLQTLVTPALFQTFVARHYYMVDLVAPALSQKSIFVTNFVARGAPRLCYKQKVLIRCRLLLVEHEEQPDQPGNASYPRLGGRLHAEGTSLGSCQAHPRVCSHGLCYIRRPALQALPPPRSDLHSR